MQITQDVVTDYPRLYTFRDCFADFDPGSLPSGDYRIECRLFDHHGKCLESFGQPFTRKAYEGPRTFVAKEGVYSYGGAPGHAVVVQFPDAKEFVLWEHAQYVPWWDIGNMAVTYEFVESWGYGTMGCAEPMQDKENRYSKPEIVENSPARVVVQWRYALGGHWPLQKNNVDVFSIVSTHRPYHGWLGSFHVFSDASIQPNRWVHIFGATDRDDAYVKEILASWLDPADVAKAGPGWRFAGLDATQMAYVFEAVDASRGSSSIRSCVRRRFAHQKTGDASFAITRWMCSLA
jgi:hypothetical protein